MHVLYLHTMTLACTNSSYHAANIQTVFLDNGAKHNIQLATYNTYHQLANISRTSIKQRDQPCFE